VLELAGIRYVLAKRLGTTNPINMARATVDGLRRLRRPEAVARARGKSIKDVLPFKVSAVTVEETAAETPAEEIVPAEATAAETAPAEETAS
jgi:small subunit ribosomal protein S5